MHPRRGEQPKAHQGGTCTEFGLMRRSFLLVSDASPPHESARHVSIGWEWGERGDMTRFVKLASVHVHVFGCPICSSLTCNYRKKTILTPPFALFSPASARTLKGWSGGWRPPGKIRRVVTLCYSGLTGVGIAWLGRCCNVATLWERGGNGVVTA